MLVKNCNIYENILYNQDRQQQLHYSFNNKKHLLNTWSCKDMNDSFHIVDHPRIRAGAKQPNDVVKSYK